MIIARIEGATRVVGKSQGYLGLPIRDEIILEAVNGPATTSMVTAWEPIPEEIERLRAGSCVHVRILGDIHPPILVTVGPVP